MSRIINWFVSNFSPFDLEANKKTDYKTVGKKPTENRDSVEGQQLSQNVQGNTGSTTSGDVQGDKTPPKAKSSLGAKVGNFFRGVHQSLESTSKKVEHFFSGAVQALMSSAFFIAAKPDELVNRSSLTTPMTIHADVQRVGKVITKGEELTGGEKISLHAGGVLGGVVGAGLGLAVLPIVAVFSALAGLYALAKAGKKGIKKLAQQKPIQPSTVSVSAQQKNEKKESMKNLYNEHVEKYGEKAWELGNIYSNESLVSAFKELAVGPYLLANFKSMNGYHEKTEKGHTLEIDEIHDLSPNIKALVGEFENQYIKERK